LAIIVAGVKKKRDGKGRTVLILCVKEAGLKPALIVTGVELL